MNETKITELTEALREAMMAVHVAEANLAIDKSQMEYHEARLALGVMSDVGEDGKPLHTNDTARRMRSSSPPRRTPPFVATRRTFKDLDKAANYVADLAGEKQK